MSEMLTPQDYSKHLFGRVHCLDIWRAVIDATVEAPHTFREVDFMLKLMQTIQPTAAQQEFKTLGDCGLIEIESTSSRREP